MHFSHLKIYARNKYFSFIQFYMQIYGSSGFKKCKKCNGTGLIGVQELTIESIRNQGWGGEFCDVCDGKGFLIKKDLIDTTPFFTTCNDCSGEGFTSKGLCKKCDGVGFVDWVSNITGSFNLSDLRRELKNRE